MDRFVVVFLSLLSHGVAQNIGFISPQYAKTNIGGNYGSNTLWPLGSTQIVAFSCPWESYRLELWQQDLYAQSAMVSSEFVYNQSAGEHLDQSFQWTVQTYELQLADSPVFLWWLFNNNDSTMSQTSSYFNITIGAASDPTSSSDTPTSTLSTPSSTQTTSSPSSSTISSTAGTSTATQAALNSPSPTAVSRELSTGAAVGVGVGAAFGGILILAAVVFLFLKWKRRQGILQPQSELPGSESVGYMVGTSGGMVPTSLYIPKPGETPPHYYLQAAELRG
ncbi:hypothetical protein O1611_g7381 [Lasiodiplodia mahajangana]|uniref:Uncharacterized protein n=1 Tax=Lasiodiplodia mahajangana TaxID=1108764 RepID=A0ACC2JFT8_9PEZI|nr:hypothetical protein O1611_g7381 [Lasiodiplodia mahajangana]